MTKSSVTGLLFIALGLVFGIGSLQYTLGTVSEAGPGFYPLVVSTILFVLGVITLIKNRLSQDEPVEIKLKNITIIIVSLVGFAIVTQYLGMIAGTSVLIAVASFAASEYSMVRVIKIIIGLTVVMLAFKYILGMNLPL